MLNLDISPNSEIIPAQEIKPMPLIDKVAGSSSLIIFSILDSNSLICSWAEDRNGAVDKLNLNNQNFVS